MTVYTVVVVGDTTNDGVVAVVFQLYVVAPLAVKVALDPEQILTVLTDTVGCGVIVSVPVLFEEQPFVIPVTV